MQQPQKYIIIPQLCAASSWQLVHVASGRAFVQTKKSHGYAKAFDCRDDKIRTCDPTPPRRVRYRAALHPVGPAANVEQKPEIKKNHGWYAFVIAALTCH